MSKTLKLYSCLDSALKDAKKFQYTVSVLVFNPFKDQEKNESYSGVVTSTDKGFITLRLHNNPYFQVITIKKSLLLSVLVWNQPKGG